MSPICRRRISTSHAQALNALETTLLLWHTVPCHAAHDCGTRYTSALAWRIHRKAPPLQHHGLTATAAAHGRLGVVRWLAQACTRRLAWLRWAAAPPAHGRLPQQPPLMPKRARRKQPARNSSCQSTMRDPQYHTPHLTHHLAALLRVPPGRDQRQKGLSKRSVLDSVH
jgi:hypothetical protein